jgi:anti-sigma factor RsiW
MEMTCRELVDFLGAHLDGELSEEVRRRFEEHLAACPECFAYVEAYRATVRLARGAFRDPDGPVPADVPEDLVKAILAARRKG